MPKALDQFECASYRQGKEIAATNVGPQHSISGGVCFSLCCQWIELHREIRSGGALKRMDAMKQRIGSLKSDSIYFYRAVNSQMNTYDLSQETTKLGMKDEVGKKYGIKFENSLGDIKCIPPDYRLDDLRNEVDHTHLYTQTSFQLKKGRHAICAYKSGGKIFGMGAHLYVFDPNFGEFRVSSGEIKDFYQALFDRYKPVTSHITFKAVGI
ncbi:YopT-type cysteine protease domain-containing protein [Azospirillum sp. B21]|uniref:YopT-type cysteine protease domain-containing protein n=1 Tax=Azospirillum sp. B21 TaxID=2607496 RepID=UPI00165F6CBF|nr:YopT-type cysteine protease domain-containing protein [Azospirillum sp. B21]